MDIIHNCRYTELNTNNDILSYNDIIHLHGEVVENWKHPWGYYKGPQLDRITKKGLPLFPRLEALNVDAAVAFYDNFQKASIYLLPVMPFDCICIKMGFEVLCPPGLGLPCCAMIAWVLMEILPKFLPCFDTQITSLITMTCMELENGYDLLWQVLMLTVPGFDPTISVMIPVWQKRIFLNLRHPFAYTSGYRQRKGLSTTTAAAALHS
jgi:hypothetical protein